jgi:DNA-binding HxlR family transcriptional regulator
MHARFSASRILESGAKRGAGCADKPGGKKAPARQIRTSSLNRALAVVGDLWSLLIVRDAFLGVRSFDEFQRRLEIPRQTLINRLRHLVEHFVLFKKPYRERPLRYEYRLTGKGLDLYAVVLMVWRWQTKWGNPEPLPPVLLHRTCGRAMHPVIACRQCAAEVHIEDIDIAAGPGAGLEPAGPRGKRWTLPLKQTAAERRRVGQHLPYLMADRWTHLVLSTLFRGKKSYEAIQAELQIASNILAHRLRLLAETGLVRKSSSVDDARRFVYELTAKGHDVFPMSLSLAMWADRWLLTSAGPPRISLHRPCGSHLDAIPACSECSVELKPWEVSFEPGK